MALFEIILVIILICLLFLVGMNRLLPLRGAAEQAAVTGSIGAMQAALGNRVAATVVKEGFAALPQFEGRNPVEFLAQPPADYRGAQSPLELDAMAPGDWAFDSSRGVLVYRVRYAQYLSQGLRNPPRGEWRIELRYEGEGRRAEELRSVLLTPLAELRWRMDEAEQ